MKPAAGEAGHRGPQAGIRRRRPAEFDHASHAGVVGEGLDLPEQCVGVHGYGC